MCVLLNIEWHNIFKISVYWLVMCGCLFYVKRKISFSLKCEQNKQDKIVVGGSNGLDSNNMEKSSSICGHSEESGKWNKVLLARHIEVNRKFINIVIRAWTRYLLWCYIGSAFLIWKLSQHSSCFNSTSRWKRHCYSNISVLNLCGK